MMLGKRPRRRGSMTRTASLKELTVDSGEFPTAAPVPVTAEQEREFWARGGLPSPRDHQILNSGEFMETALFLRACGLCNKRLGPGRDIYMYRGDTGFCSLECRQQRMNQDEWKEKCSMASKKEQSSSNTTNRSSSSQSQSQSSTKAETAVAA
ncbi:hypothetical protein Syun_013657 [Stephania yunnanensis]|uniref:FLZ-type domain-containing protein n=1 Tax=Stephania yunnanensis TaxID=152371 RepID=A0AAP0JK21_9MAGN